MDCQTASTTLGSGAGMGPPLVRWVGPQPEHVRSDTTTGGSSTCSWVVNPSCTLCSDNGHSGVVMAKIRRNGPCPCGSGSKAKRCCYGTHEAVGLLPRTC